MVQAPDLPPDRRLSWVSRLLHVFAVSLLLGAWAAQADVLHLSCRALTPWNGGVPAKNNFSMFIDMDDEREMVKLQQDIDTCCQTYFNRTFADGGHSSVTFDPDRVDFGFVSPGRRSESYTFDLYSGTLLHDFLIPAEPGGKDRHIISTYQCINLMLQ